VGMNRRERRETARASGQKMQGDASHFGSSSPGRPHSLELNIGRLVFHDAIVRDHQHISSAAQRELTRLLTERGGPSLLSRGGTMPKLDAGTLEAVSDADAETIGIQIARSIYRGLNR
jgi:hypothetical protein